MTTRFQITPLEIKTRQLMSDAISALKTEEVYSAKETTRLIIAKVFIADYASSLPAHRIVEIGAALYGLVINDLLRERIQDELTAMVRGKFLRSRRLHGQTLYEVNY
jgi:hypothetical protein